MLYSGARCGEEYLQFRTPLWHVHECGSSLVAIALERGRFVAVPPAPPARCLLRLERVAPSSAVATAEAVASDPIAVP